MSRLDVSSICEDCGHVGKPTKRLEGAFWVEALLWIIGVALIALTAGISLLIPIGYSIRRYTAATRVCYKCGGKMISITTPRGKKLLKEMGVEEFEYNPD